MQARWRKARRWPASVTAPEEHGDAQPAFCHAADVGLCPLCAQRLLDVLQSEIDRQRSPGAVALVARRGKVALFEHLGRQDPVAGTPMTRDSIFRIYSMTKPIVSVATMMHMEQAGCC